MDLSDLFAGGSVMDRLVAATRRQALDKIAEAASTLTKVPKSNILSRLHQREMLGSTGLGAGIAIPHARLEDICAPVAIFARLESPVDFEALDGRPVDLIVTLFVPEESDSEHLKAMARIARLFGNEGFVARLRKCPDAAGLNNLLCFPEATAA